MVIDAGHGGKDPGTLGSSCKEKDIVLAVALKLGRLIQNRQSDVQVIYTRSSDVFIPLNQRANIANKAKANLFIPFTQTIRTHPVLKVPPRSHSDKTVPLRTWPSPNVKTPLSCLKTITNNDTKGFDPNSPESYIMFEFMQDKYIDKSIELASAIQNQFVRASRYDRGVRQAGFWVLHKSACPSDARRAWLYLQPR